jgi:NAD-dependent SIR2 family protein deacetylase
MYCLRWTPAEAKRRQSLLTAAALLVCEGTSLDTTPVSGETLAVSTVLNGIPAWIDAIQRMQKSFSP